MCCDSAAFMLCKSAPGKMQFQGRKLIMMIDIYYYMNLPEGVRTKNTQCRKLHECLRVYITTVAPEYSMILQVQKLLKDEDSELQNETSSSIHIQNSEMGTRTASSRTAQTIRQNTQTQANKYNLIFL